MAYDTGFSRRSSSERDLQPVAIISVDPVARLAVGATRTRHTVRINCAYATGDTITTPAVGEQWYCERFDNEWRLYGRIPFNDPTLNIEPEAGQVSVGSGVGPLELNGTEVRSNAKVLRLNGVYYRDSGQALERSIDQVTWEAITAGGLVQIVAKALTDYQGATQAGAVTALGGWGDTVQEMLSNFNLLWDLLCGNVFVNGLRRLGVGDSEVARIVDGLQNFMNYLFGTLFCDFDGDVTPQTILARLRDLLAPIVSNPFVQGLQQVAEILGVAVGDLLNDAVAGGTAFIKLVFDIVFCRWDELLPQLSNLGAIMALVGEDSPFSPATIIKQLFGTFSFLGDPDNPVGAFLAALQSFFTLLFESTGSLLQDAAGGVVEFVQVLFDVLFCQADPTKLAAILAGAGDVFGPTAIIQAIDSFFQFFRDNPFVTGLQDFLVALTGQQPGNLIQDAVAGATRFAQLIFQIITCDPTALAGLQNLVAGVTAGTGAPLGILALLKPLLDSLLANPIVAVIQAFATNYLGMTGTLLEKLLTGSGSLFYWFFKALKTFLPFIPWEALLPFGTAFWTAVNNATVPGLTFPSLITDDLFKMFDGLVGGAVGAFKNFLTNLNTFLGGMGLLNGTFNLDTAVKYFLTNILGIATNVGGVLQLGGTIVTATFGAVGDFFENLAVLLGTDLRISATSFLDNFLQIITAFADRIKLFILGGYGSLPEWAQANITTPIISQFVTGLGIDLTKLGLTPDTLATAPITKLGDIAAMLLTNLTKVPAGLLSGVLPPAVVGTVPVSNISNETPNLITLGTFSESVNVEAADGWVWDSVQTATGGGGSTRVAITSAKNRFLYSRQAVRVVKGDRLVVSAAIKTSALTTSGGTTPISIVLIPFVGSTAQTPVTIGSAVGSNTNWTTIGNTTLTPYEVTNATWTSVIVRLTVDSTATGGNVWWDDISLKKVGGLIQGNVDSLIAAWNKTIGGLTNAPTTTGKTWEDLYGAALAARGQADTGVLYSTNTNTALFNNSAGGSVFYNPGALISSLAGVKADGTYTMSNLLYFLASQLSQNAAAGAGVADVYTAANGAGTTLTTTVPTSATRINTTNNNLFGNQAGGTVFTNLSTLISNLSTIKVDATTSATMANLLAQLASGLSQGSQTAATATAVQSAAIAAGNKAGEAKSGLENTNTALFNNPAGGSTIRIQAIPTTAVGAALTTVGSGATLVRTDTAVQSVGGQTTGSTARIVPASFFNTYTSKSADINLLSGNTGFQVTLAGWYMVELAYKLNPVASWGWNFTPVLYVNGVASKFGTDVMFTWGGFPSFSSGAQRQVQNSFIVNLAALGTVQAGYNVSLGTYVNDNVLGGGTSAQTYFSISLLNRSYA